MNARQILEKIENHDSLIFFGHVDPDGDCFGATRAFQRVLKERYPNKRIFLASSRPQALEAFELINLGADSIPENAYKESLAILLDLSDLRRVEDPRFAACPDLLIIDHHAPTEEAEGYPAYRIVDAPSATYVIYKLLTEAQIPVSQTVAYYLYLGLVTDTDRFLTVDDGSALEVAAELLKTGIDVKDLYSKLYRQTPSLLKFRAYAYAHYQLSKKAAYLVVRKEVYQSIGLTQNEIANEVSLLHNADGRPYCFFFIEKEDGKVRAEYRSDGTKDVRIIPEHFANGGGHFSAAGATLDNLDAVQEIIDFVDSLD